MSHQSSSLTESSGQPDQTADGLPPNDDTIAPNTIQQGDAREKLAELPDESVRLTVTSPPYNIGKDYGEAVDDDLTIDAWKSMIQDVFEQLYRVTRPGGKVVINIGKSFSDTDDDGRFFFHPLAAYVKTSALDSGFDFWDEVIWNKQSFASRGGGALFGSYPYPDNFMVTQVHEHVLVFRKWVSESYYDSREIPDTGTQRREQAKLSKDRWRTLTQSLWSFEGVTQSDLDVDHNAVFPVELPRRAIQLYSFPGDIVLDPFAGTGTTAKAAQRMNRDFIGIDVNEKYVAYARSRLGLPVENPELLSDDDQHSLAAFS